MKVLETLAASVLRGLVAKGLGDDPLLTAAGAVFSALSKAAKGEQSAATSMQELDALADLHQLDDAMAEIRARSLADLAKK